LPNSSLPTAVPEIIFDPDPVLQETANRVSAMQQATMIHFNRIPTS